MRFDCGPAAESLALFSTGIGTGGRFGFAGDEQFGRAMVFYHGSLGRVGATVAGHPASSPSRAIRIGAGAWVRRQVSSSRFAGIAAVLAGFFAIQYSI